MLWSIVGAKGGVGTSTVVAAVAHTLRAAGPVTIVDLAGDQPDLLGVDAPGPGVWDWLRADPAVEHDALLALAVDVADRLRVVPAGTRSHRAPDHGRMIDLVDRLDRERAHVIVDVGVGESDPCAASSLLIAGSTRRTLVVRACYLALKRVQRCAVSFSDVVEIHEGGRALSTIDIEAVLGQPVTARLPVTPAIGRAVDAGLILSRMPRPLRLFGRDMCRSVGTS